jgi:membrane protease YdiL (CAAX protease family)
MTTIVSAVLAGVGVLLAGNLPWVALLAPLNLRLLPVVPWAIAPMAVYLLLYWRYIGGRIGSPGSAEMRRTSLRANPLAPDVWTMAILTGLVGFAALLALVAVIARLMTLPEAAPIAAPAGMPRLTLVLLLAMSSIVAGVTEEAGFRGYMQGPIERRYGLAMGILVNGAMFGLLHFPNHPGAVVSMLPYYIAVSAVYGGLTWATNSILPALLLHAGGDIWSLTRLWATGRPEWQLSTTPPQLVTENGVDASFLVAAAGAIVLGAATVGLCRSLRRLAMG